MCYKMFFLIILILLIYKSQALCNLCDNGVTGIKWPYAYVDSRGKHCAVLAVEMATLIDFGSECRRLQSAHRERCCGAREPVPIAQEPPPSPVSRLQKGPFPKCPICITGDYPFNTAMVINMLYIGVGSCLQYWEYGESGWIEPRLCQALQFFSQEPCGCGKFNPAFVSAREVRHELEESENGPFA